MCSGSRINAARPPHARHHVPGGQPPCRAPLQHQLPNDPPERVRRQLRQRRGGGGRHHRKSEGGRPFYLNGVRPPRAGRASGRPRRRARPAPPRAPGGRRVARARAERLSAPASTAGTRRARRRAAPRARPPSAAAARRTRARQLAARRSAARRARLGRRAAVHAAPAPARELARPPPRAARPPAPAPPPRPPRLRRAQRAAGLDGVAGGGLGLVVGRAHAGVGVGDRASRAGRRRRAELALGHRTRSRAAAGPAGLLGRPARAPARVAELVLGTLGPALGARPAGARARRRAPRPPRTRSAAAAARRRRSRRRRARAARRRGAPRRAGGGAARAVRLEAGRAHGGVEGARRTGAWRRWWTARCPRGSARHAIPARASGPATGSSRPSTAARRTGRSTRGSSR